MNECVTKPGQQHISAAEAAVRLGVSVMSVRRWQDEGKLKGWRTPGGHRRFSVAEIDRFAREEK